MLSMDATRRQRVRLINALPRTETVYLETPEGDMRALPRIDPPALLQTHAREDEIILAVECPSGETIELSQFDTARAIGTLGLPPEEDGVLYLVESEVMAQFPHRTDFVTPALWSFGTRNILRSRRSAPWRDYRVLVAVTRQPWAVADSDTPKLNFED